ncbi:hypothetical protein [Hyphomicrobium sp. ghe19]|uniref:hypothetical protein n=1 Tax=Hyphomicrobium sp. ghe19 TaxID=2682968 RepID=UPI001366C651|nr:hypothetical protein HYPP_01306 [Hyphomicrobium sp. ghe19]
MKGRLQSVFRLARPLFSADVEYPDEFASEVHSDWGWFPALALWSGVTIVVAAAAAEANRREFSFASAMFYASIAALIFPIACRMVWPGVPRAERIATILLAAVGLFCLRLIHEPISFVDHDAFLHWATANDIMRTGKLFTPNPLLPISPVYPGLEIIATALSELTTLSIFVCGQLLMFVCRMIFVICLFLFYERLSGSSRVGSLGVLVYMGASSFAFFDTTFSYGSLALLFMVIALLVDNRMGKTASWRCFSIVALPVLGGLAVTHHLTAFITAFLLTGMAAFEVARRKSTRSFGHVIAMPVAALIFSFGWSVWTGNPSEDYLGPVFGHAISEASRFLSFEGGRIPFVAEDGTTAPLWLRVTTVLSVVLLCAGLATSFFRALARAGVPVLWDKFPTDWRGFLKWDSSRLVILTLVTFAYPISIMLRMTRAGWEIGNRIGPFAFLGVGIVVAIGIVTFWQKDSRSRLRSGLIGTAMTIIVIGGIFSGSGNYILGSPRYRVSADSASVEPMAISAATWTRQWLGTRNRFFSDRTNRLLLAAYGGQQVVTLLYDKQDLGDVEFSPKFGPLEREAIREASVDYFLLDFRLTEQLPLMGFYFDPGPVYREPPDPQVLFKFNNVAGISRVFDNGYQSIINVAQARDSTDAP